MNLTDKQRHWIAWLIIAVVLTALSVGLGVTYPLPPMPLETDETLGSQSVRYTDFQNVKVANDFWVVDDVDIDGDVDVDGTLNADTVDFDGALDMGANTITNIGNAGTDFGSNGSLTTAQTITITAGGLVVTAGGATITDGGLDMTDDAISNIGNSGTDFDANGGLTTASTITVTSGGLIVTAGGATITDGGLDMTDDAISNIGNSGTDFDVNGGLTTASTITVTAGGMVVSAGLTDIGSGTYTLVDSDNDLGIAGDLEVNGTIEADGVISQVINLENVGMLPTVASASVVSTTTDGALFTVGADEIWVVHGVWVNVTTNFDCTGDDCTLIVGDSNDTDGFCVLADAELQASDTEGTGWEAGWQCQVAATRGVYQDGTGGFIYSGSETIDVDVGGTDCVAGAATVYILYTRIQ